MCACVCRLYSPIYVCAISDYNNMRFYVFLIYLVSLRCFLFDFHFYGINGGCNPLFCSYCRVVLLSMVREREKVYILLVRAWHFSNIMCYNTDLSDIVLMWTLVVGWMFVVTAQIHNTFCWSTHDFVLVYTESTCRVPKNFALPCWWQNLCNNILKVQGKKKEPVRGTGGKCMDVGRFCVTM